MRPATNLMNGIKVLVVDDREQLHSALRLFLAQSGRGQVVEDITHLDQLLGAVLQHQPDLLMLDWELPGLRAQDNPRYPLHVLRAVSPQMAIVAMSSYPEAKASSLAAGVDFFASKADSPQQLLTILRSVYPRLRLLACARYAPSQGPAPQLNVAA